MINVVCNFLLASLLEMLAVQQKRFYG